MSNKKKNKRVGQGMKPRVPQTEASGEVQPVEVVEEVSTTTGQPDNQNEAQASAQEPVQTGGEIAGESVQNLDSEKTGDVAADTPSGGAAPATCACGGDWPAGHTVHTEEWCGTPEAPLAGTTVEQRANLEEMMGKAKDENPLIRVTRDEAATISGKTSIAEIEEAMNQNRKIELLPNGDAVIGPSVGLRSDGTFGLVITIPEGMIDPIRQQAEADGLTPEEWVSTRMNEYLESWWSAPKGR